MLKIDPQQDPAVFLLPVYTKGLRARHEGIICMPLSLGDEIAEKGEWQWCVLVESWVSILTNDGILLVRHKGDSATHCNVGSP